MYSKPGEEVTEMWHQLSIRTYIEHDLSSVMKRNSLTITTEAGMGLVRIPQPRSANLPKSFSIAEDDASSEIFMTSGAHQLHCLVSLLQPFCRLEQSTILVI